MSNPAPAPDHAVLVELEDLLCSIATGVLPNRSEAIVYSRCRADLLQSRAKELLPGFVYQCPTVFKFKEFITLYDPDMGLREAFVRRTFERCRAMLDQSPPPPAPDTRQPARPDPFDPQRWML